MNNTEVPNISDQPAGINEVAEGTDIEGLRTIMDVPGEPVRVWYGPYAPSAGSRIPGPTDVLYTALIEYASPVEVASLVGESQGDDWTAYTPGWFPQELRDEAAIGNGAMLEIPTAAYQPGQFDGSYVKVPTSAPQFAIVPYDGG